MSDPTIVSIVQCQQAVLRCYQALDARDSRAVAEGIAEDGVWYRQGEVLRGPIAVKAALDRRPPGRVTAHLVQNLVVDLDEGGSAHARYLTLVFRVDLDGVANLPVPMAQPFVISAVKDTLRREGDAWLLVERSSSPIFGG